MRKILSLCLFLILMIVPFAMTQAAPSEVTNVRWVTRNDAAIPYVRLVLDLTKPTMAEATIESNGKTTEVILKNTVKQETPKKITMDPKIVTHAQFIKSGQHLLIKMQTPFAIDEEDIKVFRLKKDEANKKPDRLVIDIRQKNVESRTYKANKKPQVIAPAKNKSSFKSSGGLAGKVIVLDPGHGGSDPGAIGANGTMEKTITLSIANYLKEYLKDSGAKVIMTRTTDVDVYGPHASGPDELQARADVANNHNADIFLSLHINSFNNPAVGGITSYYYTKSVYDSKLASSIQKYIANKKGFSGDRGVQPGNLYVLRHTTMPAALLELGFLSNVEERTLLEKEKTQREFAELIFKGIEEYFQG